MTAAELCERLYPELARKVRERFPEFWKTAEETTVIPWREEFQVADYNPELIDEIEFWRTLLKEGLVSAEEYRCKVRQIGYASRTEGISFMGSKEVSFRSEVPTKAVLLHEIGHVHYREPDPVWSSAYGGGEVLFWLGLEGRYRIGEAEVRRFHSLYRRAQEGEHKEVAEEIVRKIAPLYGEQIVPAFYPICLFTGWMPEGASSFGIDIFDLKDSRWLEVEPTRTDVVMFFINLTEGLKWQDGFWIEYARRLGIID